MNFLVIVVALLLDRAAGWIEGLRLHRWYERPLAGWAGWFANTPAGVQFAAALFPSFLLAFVAGAVAWGLTNAGIVLGFIWGVVILVLSFGPRHLGSGVASFLRARASGDDERARRAAAWLIGREPPAAPMDRARAMSEAALLRAGESLFSVLFWFALLGPLGAVLVKVADRLAVRGAADRPGSAYTRSAEALTLVLAWLPMHLLALTYALAGNGRQVVLDMRRSWTRAGGPFLRKGHAVVAGAGRDTVRGMVASGCDEIELLHATANIVWRAVIIWLAVIGVITLLTWIF